MSGQNEHESRNVKRRVLVLDDHPITRYGVVQLIADQPDLAVCGELETADEALAAVAARRPDLILADLSMPGKSGLDFIREVQAQHPGTAVLVMSMHDENVYAERVLRAGGRGYIMKSEGGSRLLEAIRTVLGGKVFVSGNVSARILAGYSRRGKGVSGPRPGLLSDREFEVFQLIGQGLSTREISERLHLSIKTVGTHRLHIREKLKVRTSSDLLRQAVRWASAQQLV
jgi:DNA-binding NarL/FixJ family response regulator